MSLVSYSPFDVSLNDLSVEKLAILRTVAEGWYVEYKGQPVVAKNIAKSVSAFANHYGGWIFYGVVGTKGDNIAQSFPGLDKDGVALMIERLRDAARHSISPSPYYDHKILAGPCSEIGLADDRFILVVVVPTGPNAPYIHSDGRIYRRVADASDPKPETDRFILDQLWKRGQDAQTKLEEFLQTQPTLSQTEEKLSHLDLFLLPDPLQSTGQRTKLSFDGFIELMDKQFDSGYSLPFDNFFLMADGFVARQIGAHNPSNLVLTWKHYTNGFSIISLPFPFARVDELITFSWLKGYIQKDAFEKILTTRGYFSNFVLDINQLMVFIVGILAQQKRLMESGGIVGPLYAKAALCNIWRRIPFLDIPSYIQFVSKHGLPVIQFDEELAPPGTTFDSLALLSPIPPDGRDPLIGQMLEAMPIFLPILNALGLSTRLLMKETGDLENCILANTRAMEVGRHRQNAAENW